MRVLVSAVLLGAAGLMLWIRVLTYEEPRLAKQFGAEFDEYRRNVRSWIPRGKPWRSS